MATTLTKFRYGHSYFHQLLITYYLHFHQCNFVIGTPILTCNNVMLLSWSISTFVGLYIEVDFTLYIMGAKNLLVLEITENMIQKLQ